MQPKHIIFDLDGTLTDSGEGILNCVETTLRHFNLPVPNRQDLRVFVGPPLRDIFLDFGVLPEQIEEAITVYRSRYNTIGKFENFPYPGIPEMLAKLKSKGCKLTVATSKPEGTAVEIMEKFQLAQFFDEICGATPDGSRDEKSKIIACLLERLGGTTNTWMVGDTHFDVLGAASHGIPAIGVAWGYGKVADMQNAGAAAIVYSVDELYSFLADS